MTPSGPTRHVAFLRAINLGAQRKFPKTAVADAVRAAGFEEVEVHLNTGNVGFLAAGERLDLERRLEEAFLAAAGFEVPTVVMTAAEMRDVVEHAAEFSAPGDDVGHHVSFLKAEPTAEAVAALQAAARDDERAVVRGRAAHLLLGADYHRAKLTNALVERHLGVATARRITVVREVARRWC